MAGRAIVALGLMVGFYVFAVAIALGLLYIPYAEWVYVHRLHFKLAIFCVAGAALILFSLVPRSDSFAAPGPLLSAARQPRLFETIGQVAATTGQSMPEEVYLVSDLNAWVAQRGGMMGFGSRRVMGLGLPLLQVLSVNELRAVLAHEFGHFHAGDTKLGPWIYKTRAAIGRTLEGLAHHSSTLQMPFILYGNMFLRVTHGVSRRQELTADELAADTVGARPLIDGLKKIHAAGPLFHSFWSTEVVPVLEAGFMPPIIDGFRRFIAVPGVAAHASRLIEEAMAATDGSPYDTHPPLRERVEAVASFSDQPAADGEGPAIDLLVDAPGLERVLLGPFVETVARSPAPIRWEDVGVKVYAMAWAESRERYASHLPVTPIPDLAQSVPALVQRLIERAREEGDAATPDEEVRIAAASLAEILADALVRAGWEIDARLGERVALRGPSSSLDPLQIVRSMLFGQLAPADWQRQCADPGLAGVTLGERATKPLTPEQERDARMARLVEHAMTKPAAPASARPQPATSVQCWSCKATLPVPAEARGTTVKCPACRTKQRLPV